MSRTEPNRRIPPRRRPAAPARLEDPLSARNPQKAQSLRNLAVIEQALADKMTPLEIMMRNLRWFQERAETRENLVRAAHRDVREIPEVELAEVTRLRLLASRLATEAAPYVHPRLAAIEMTGNEGGPLQVFMDMQPDERRRQIGRLADRLGIVPGANPVLKDNEGS